MTVVYTAASWPLPTFHTYNLILVHTMPRCQDVIVSNTVRNIAEVVVTHTKTKQGTVRSTEKTVPIVLPQEDHSGPSSKSRKTNEPLQPRPKDARESANETDIIDGACGDSYLDDRDNVFPDPDPDPTVEEGQPRTPVCPHLIYSNKYAYTTQIQMEQWLQFRDQYLHVLLDMEARPLSDTCSMCHKSARLKCPDCFGSPSYCEVCIPYAHMHSPFHRPLLWTATHYTQVSLQSLGFALCLGHAGVPCPSTVEVCGYDVCNYGVVLITI